MRTLRDGSVILGKIARKTKKKTKKTKKKCSLNERDYCRADVRRNACRENVTHTHTMEENNNRLSHLSRNDKKYVKYWKGKSSGFKLRIVL